MAYYSRHSIFLYDNDKQKLLYLQTLIEEEELSQLELNKVCEELNQKNAEVPVPLFEVIDIAHHPTVLFHFGAYTFIGYNVFELYSEDNRTYGAVASLGHSSRNYNHLPYRAKAQQILYDYLLEIRKAGKLRP